MPLKTYLSQCLVTAVQVLADNIVGRLLHHLLDKPQQMLLVHA